MQWVMWYLAASGVFSLTSFVAISTAGGKDAVFGGLLISLVVGLLWPVFAVSMFWHELNR